MLSLLPRCCRVQHSSLQTRRLFGVVSAGADRHGVGASSVFLRGSPSRAAVILISEPQSASHAS